MLEAVHRFETVFGRQAGVRHMAVITRRVASMRGMAPCGIIRRNNLAVNQSRRVIGDLGVRTEKINAQSAQAHQDACANQKSDFLLIGETVLQRFQSINNLHQ